jgi:hypothetical protein
MTAKRALRRLFPLLPFTAILFGLATSAACTGGGRKHSVLPSPTMVSATAGDGEVTVSWADVPGAISYTVIWAKDPTVTSENYGNLDGGGADHGATSPDTIGGLDNGSTYFFLVVANDDAGAKGADSSRVAASPTIWLRRVAVEADQTGDALEPDLATDATGDLHAAWSRNTGGRYQIRWAALSAGGGAWDAPMTIDSNAGAAYNPRLAVDAGGDVTAVWRQGNGTIDDVWSNAYTGGAWGTPQRIESGAADARNPDVATGGGVTLAAWTQYAVGNTGSIFSAVETAPGTWAAEQEIDGAGNAADEAQIAVDGSGRGLAVWVQGNAVRGATYTGGWNAAMLVSTALTPAHPRLAMNAAGDAVAVWETQHATGGIDIAAATYTVAGGWSNPVLLEGTPLESSSPAVAIDAAGDAVLVWIQSDGLHRNVVATEYFPATGWASGAALIEDNDTGDAKSPAVAITPAGNATAVWAQEVSGTTGIEQDIFGNRLATGTTNWDVAMGVSQPGLNDTPAITAIAGGQVSVIWTTYGVNGLEIWSNFQP